MGFFTGFFASFMVGRALNDVGASDRNYEKKLEQDNQYNKWLESLKAPEERRLCDCWTPKKDKNPWPW